MLAFRLGVGYEEGLVMLIAASLLIKIVSKVVKEREVWLRAKTMPESSTLVIVIVY